MKTYKAVCIKDLYLNGEQLLKRGEKYIISLLTKEKVIVFSTYWFKIKKKYFKELIKFTE